MADSPENLKSENHALRQLKVLENTLKTMTDTVKQCHKYEKQIKEYEKQIKTNEDSMQQLRTGFEQQKKRADIYEKNLTNVLASYKGQQQKLQQAEQKIKELELRIPIQLQRYVQVGIKRIALQPLPNSQPQKNPSGQYINWNLAHERSYVENCYISSKLIELSVIEAINKGCVVDTNISTMYQVNRYNRFPGNGEYLAISLSELTDAQCAELTNFNCAFNVMSQSTLKVLVDFLCNRKPLYFSKRDRDCFERGNGLTWNDSL